MSTAAYSGAMSPLEGEAFLHSQMKAGLLGFVQRAVALRFRRAACGRFGEG